MLYSRAKKRAPPPPFTPNFAKEELQLFENAVTLHTLTLLMPPCSRQSAVWVQAGELICLRGKSCLPGKQRAGFNRQRPGDACWDIFLHRGKPVEREWP